MYESNQNLKIKGFVFKKFPVELKIIFIINIIVHIVILVLYSSGNEKLGNEIFALIMILFFMYWLFYCLFRKQELEIEEGNFYINKEEVILKGYKVEYDYGNKIYLKTLDENFLFYAYSGILPTRTGTMYLRERVKELERHLKNKKKPIENNFNISGNKIFFLYLSTIVLIPLITAITQAIVSNFFK